MKEEYFKWQSPNLNREIEMLVFGHAGYPVILFPTSMGSYHENKDQGLIKAAQWYIDQGLIQIFCPDSIDKDSFYNKNIHPFHRIQNHVWYDKMGVCFYYKNCLYRYYQGKKSELILGRYTIEQL